MLPDCNQKESGCKKKQYTDADLIEQLYDLAKRLDRTPTMGEFEADPDTASRLTIIKRFGSWRNFVVAAGLVPNERGGKVGKNNS